MSSSGGEPASASSLDFVFFRTEKALAFFPTPTTHLLSKYCREISARLADGSLDSSARLCEGSIPPLPVFIVRSERDAPCESCVVCVLQCCTCLAIDERAKIPRFTVPRHNSERGGGALSKRENGRATFTRFPTCRTLTNTCSALLLVPKNINVSVVVNGFRQ